MKTILLTALILTSISVKGQTVDLNKPGVAEALCFMGAYIVALICGISIIISNIKLSKKLKK